MTGDWLRCCRELRLLGGGQGLTLREATLCFTRSRTHVVDEAREHSRRRMIHLSFEDFIECLVRTGLRLPVPTDEEIREAGCADAAEFVLQLRDNDEAHSKFAAEAATRPAQPPGRCVEHLLAVITRTVKAATAVGTKDTRLTERELKVYHSKLADESSAVAQ